MHFHYCHQAIRWLKSFTLTIAVRSSGQRKGLYLQRNQPELHLR